MTKTLLAASLLWAVAGSSLAQSTPAELTPSAPRRPAAEPFTVSARGPHHRVWERVEYETGPGGRAVPKVSSYTELSTGMHYSKDGQWRESRELIEPFPDGAIARHGPHKVIFAPNLATAGAVEVETPLGVRLRTHVLGISYFDPSTGKSVLLADVKDCVGEIEPPNRVIYRDAFSDLRADVRYTYTQAGFEQDVILHEMPAPPEKYGLNPDATLLQVLTEFIAPPAPTRVAAPLGNSLDEALDFGSWALVPGKAYSEAVEAGSPLGATTTREGVPVQKQWLKLEGRDFLIEQVEIRRVEAELQALPRRQASIQSATNLARHVVSHQRLLPDRGKVAAVPAVGPVPKMRLAAVSQPAAGFVMDYIAVNSSLTNFTFQGDTTYYVTGAGLLFGTTKFEGGAVVKYTNNCYLRLFGPADCDTSPYRPVVFTSKDDNSVGQTINGSTGNPTNFFAKPALDVVLNEAVNLQNLRIAYAQRAIGRSFTPTLTCENLQMVNCQVGFAVGYYGSMTVWLKNALLAQMENVFDFSTLGGGAGITAEHTTFATCSALVGPTSAQAYGLKATNCVFSLVTNAGWSGVMDPHFTGSHNGYFSSFGGATPGNVALTLTAPPFQAMGAAAHYLTVDTCARNSGTTNISAGLRATLTHLTTDAPVLRSNLTVAVDTTLTPITQRDTDVPDLGFHYAPIDYLAVAYAFTNCTLTLTPGTVVAYYDTTGVWLQDGAAISSEGTPASPVRFVDHHAVQEQSVKLAGTSGFPVNCYRYGSVGSSAYFRFTEFTRLAPGATANNFYVSDSSWKFSELTVRDCAFYNGNASLWAVANVTLQFHNNLCHRTTVSITDYETLNAISFRNNLFYGGAFYYDAFSESRPTVKDNVFHGTTVAGDSDPELDHGYNACVSGAGRIYPTNANDVVLSSLSYTNGPLGFFYQVATDLANRGSRTADLAGLFHHTAFTNQVKETNSTVDIGFHYVAWANGVPVDTDADGLGDYFEDSNGNGAYNSGSDLSDYTATDTDGDGMPDGWMWQHFGHPLAEASDNSQAGDDYDNDGDNNLDEFQNETDPNTIVFCTLFDSLRVNGNTVTGAVTALAGVPAKIALRLDNTNFAAAAWGSFNTTFTTNIGATDGTHFLYVGLKGRADTSEATWIGYSLTRDTVAPLTVITNPAPGVVFWPYFQLQGYSTEALSGVRYHLTNSSGILTNREGYVVKQFVNTNTLEVTTNWFACLDLEMAPGTNAVGVQVTDWAGNVTTTNLDFVFAYPSNAPTVRLAWPQPDTLVSGINFTLRGFVDDPTAQVTAQIAGGGITNTLSGIVERDGKFWIENLPLAAGTNSISLASMNVGTNTAITNFTVVKSAMELTIDPPSASVLNDSFITVYGTINTNNYKVWVNGMQVTNISGGSWYVEGVPLNDDGTAVIQASAIATTDNGGDGSGGNGGQGATFGHPGNPSSPTSTTVEADLEKEPKVLLTCYAKQRAFLSMSRSQYPVTAHLTERIQWVARRPGFWFQDNCEGDTFGDDYYYGWSNRSWENNGNGTLHWNFHRGGKAEVCGVRLGSNESPYTVSAGWPGESCATTGYRVQDDHLGGKYDQVVARTARTIFELRTGGKATFSNPKHLFVLSGDAEGVGNPFWSENDNKKRAFPIPKTRIILGTLGRLGSDGLLYKALKNGETHDITPTDAGNPYYTYGTPGQSKHKLIHQTQCAAATDTSSARLNVGVGELVNLYFSPAVSMTSPEQPWWMAFAGSVSTALGSGTVFTAPSNAGSALVRVAVRDAQLDTVFNVKEPSGIDHATIISTYINDPALPTGQAGAAMALEVVIAPTSVSFCRVSISEVGGDATNITGYFTNTNLYTTNPAHYLHHYPGGPPNEWNWQPLNDDNSFGDQAGILPTMPLPQPWSSGSFSWEIPVRWKIGDGPTNSMSGWAQVMTINSNGTVSVTKFNQTVVRGTNGVTTPSL